MMNLWVITISVTRNIKWLGPFGWPKYEGDLPPLPDVPGVYLITLKYKNGYKIAWPGWTARTMPERFRRHTRDHMRGLYSVRGVRNKIVWKGFWNWGGEEPSRKDKAEYRKGQPEINDAVRRWFKRSRIFVANIGNDDRYLRRLESAIIKYLHGQRKTRIEMQSSGRWEEEGERPITVHSKCAVKIHGLPSRLII
jgi:hypothetical protein